MPVSSLSLRSGTGNLAKLAVLSFLGLASSADAIAAPLQYELKSTYQGEAFFDAFDFYTGSDPNNGFVTYLSKNAALSDDLLASDDTYSYMFVDNAEEIDPNGPGRAATKLISKETFNHGLFIADIANMPGGRCGTIPSYYIGGGQGKITTISGMNEADENLMSLFTTGPFDVTGNGGIGTQKSTTCETGCSVLDTNYNSYGLNFNDNSGGVFATQWDSTGVNIWFWPIGADMPGDVESSAPDPSGWGNPVASFTGANTVDGILSNGKIVFDTNFCGTIMESLWSQSTCGDLATTCREYVAANPEDYDEQYWAVTYVKVFQTLELPTPAPSSSSAIPPMSSTQAASISSTSAVVPALSFSTPASIASTVVASSSSSMPTGTSLPNASGYSYYGCVRDIGTRQLTGDHDFSESMTLERCASYCQDYSVFGVEYKNECYCGDEFQAAVTMLPESECHTPCSGNSAQKCGGEMALSVYSVDPVIDAPQPAVSSSSTMMESTRSSTLESSSSSSTSAYIESTSSTSISESTSSTSSEVSSATDVSSMLESVLSSSSTAVLSGMSETSSSVAAMTSSYTTESTSESASYSPAMTTSASFPEETTTLYGTSTVYATSTYTVTSCAAMITNCPVGLVTVTTYPVSTTVYPLSQTSSAAEQEMTTKTLYATSIYTITACAATVTNCPALIGKVTTATISSYTTICPVSDSEPQTTTAPTGAPIASHGGKTDLITTVIVTTYVDICPTGLTTIATTVTKTLLANGPSASIPMVTSTTTLTLSGKVQTLTLTVPSTPFAPKPVSSATATEGAKKENMDKFTQSESATATPASNPDVVVIFTTMVVIPTPVGTKSPSESSLGVMYPTAGSGNATLVCPGPGCVKGSAGMSATGGAMPSATGGSFVGASAGASLSVRVGWTLAALLGAVMIVL